MAPAKVAPAKVAPAPGPELPINPEHKGVEAHARARVAIDGHHGIHSSLETDLDLQTRIRLFEDERLQVRKKTYR